MNTMQQLANETETFNQVDISQTDSYFATLKVALEECSQERRQGELVAKICDAFWEYYKRFGKLSQYPYYRSDGRFLRPTLTKIYVVNERGESVAKRMLKAADGIGVPKLHTLEQLLNKEGYIVKHLDWQTSEAVICEVYKA